MAGLSGNITLQQGPKSDQLGHMAADQEVNTLEEPVSETILRDLKRIAFKLKYVLIPKSAEQEKAKQLRDWDLWGPLLLCLLLALTLSISSTTGSSQEDTASLVFGIVFVVVWVGAAVVTINAQLLGGTVSFFQSVCLLGYCIFPMNVASLLVIILGFVPYIKIPIVLAGFAWSTLSSIGFMTQLVPESRKVLAEYPVILFYLFLGWFILVI
ncbi:YIPF6_2 [Blepharisma stoltei]|uniref:Protein YIPF n=1 Tax=Blepharisma stoltei TaxID=1481888 RepID=A0AAU9J7D4_9CILI|nr:unnamed protein product [Blepharisma stoltei]